MPTSTKMARSMLEWTRVPMFIILSILGITSVTSTNAIASQKSPFVPQDNYLISCGASGSVQLDDGRTFRSDPESVSFLPQWTSRSQLTILQLLLHHYPHCTCLQEFSLMFQLIASLSRSLAAIGSVSTSYLSLTKNTTSPQQHSLCSLTIWFFSMTSPS